MTGPPLQNDSSTVFRTEHRKIGTWLPLVVLGAGLLITLILWRQERGIAILNLQDDFNFQSQLDIEQIKHHLEAQEQLLRGVQGLFNASEQVGRSEFHAYLSPLQLASVYPGLQGISYASIVPAAEMETHIATTRKQGFPDYTIHPAGERDSYTPVIYLEPFSGRNLRVLGYDTFTEPVRRTAMEKARDTGEAALSEKVTLRQENSPSAQTGLLMFMPVYRHGVPHNTTSKRRTAINGWVAGSFRMDDLITGIFRERTQSMRISIHDGETPSEENLLYASPLTLSPASSPFSLQKNTSINVAGRTWAITIRPPAGFETGSGADKPQLVASGGVVLSLLLALFTWQMTTSRSRALETARSMNRELIESETRYRQMFDGNTSITYLVDPDDGRIIDANEAAAAFWGYSLDELRTMRITDINIASLEVLQNMWKSITSHGNYINEWRHKLKSGEIRCVEIFGGPLSFQNKTLLFFITHDITERKQAEQALAVKQQQLEELNASLEERVSRAVDELRRKDKILIQQNRQAAMGEMINNIAHQWRQPLNSLGLVIQNTRYEYDAGLLTPDQMALDMKLGMELIQFMSQTIDDFRTFFREDKEIKRFSIADSISRAITLLEGSLMSHGINITTEQEEDLLIDGYPNEYAQALLNLLINARDALLEQEVEHPEIKIKFSREGDYAVVSIADNAGGIPVDFIGQIFDPYFTTKKQEKGTGIGLYMSKMIIEKHMGGSLKVTNLEGGAEFRIKNRLPAEA